MRADTELDLFSLVGAMPDVACEHSQHEGEHADGPAAYYVKTACKNTGCSNYPKILAFCEFVVQIYYFGGAELECRECGTSGSGPEFWTLLGKI